MKDRIPHRAVAVAGTECLEPAGRAAVTLVIDLHPALIDVVAEPLLRRDGLAVEIGAAPAVIAREPLMGMQVEDMGFLRSGMEIAEHDRVVQVGMVNVRRIVAELLKQRRVAIGPGGEEEFFIKTLGAIGRRADALAVGQKHVAHAAGPVIDRKAVADPGKLALAKGAKLFEGAGVEGLQLIMQEDREFAKALFRRVGQVDHGVEVGMDDLMRVATDLAQHVQDRHAVFRRLIGRDAGQRFGRARMIAEVVIVFRREHRVEGLSADLAAIPAAVLAFGHDRAEKPVRDRPAIPFAPGGRAG